jgi:thiamine-phosphate pyrophosphorylase
MRNGMRGYYFITDAALSAAGILSDMEKAVSSGVKIIQYRSKDAQTRDLYNEAHLLKIMCGSATRLIINDRIDIALAVNADGVHLGQDDMPYHEARRLLGKDKLIGVTVHSVREAFDAEHIGADYLGVSPIFSTATKSDAGKPCGVETLRAIREACKIPLVAIGGIDLSNTGAVIEAGADMVCAISAVVTKPDVAAEIQKFQKEFGL